MGPEDLQKTAFGPSPRPSLAADVSGPTRTPSGSRRSWPLGKIGEATRVSHDEGAKLRPADACSVARVRHSGRPETRDERRDCCRELERCDTPEGDRRGQGSHTGLTPSGAWRALVAASAVGIAGCSSSVIRTIGSVTRTPPVRDGSPARGSLRSHRHREFVGGGSTVTITGTSFTGATRTWPSVQWRRDQSSWY